MKKTLILIITGLLTITAEAGNWSLGAGALVSANPYKTMDTNVLGIPFISYRGQYFSWFGPQARLQYPLSRQSQTGVQFNLGMQKFEPNDASGSAMPQLNKRTRLWFVGPFYRLRGNWGQVTTALNYDVSGRSDDGVYAAVDYAFPFNFRSNSIYIRPSIGLNWYSEAIGTHYYQISQTESTLSGLNQYSGKSFFEPNASLFANFKLSNKIHWTNIVNVNYLTNPVYDSPMVKDKRYTFSVISGLTYEISD